MAEGLDQKPTPGGHADQHKKLSTEHLIMGHIKKFIDDENNRYRDEPKGKSHEDIV